MTEHDEFEHEVEDDENGTFAFIKFIAPVLLLCAVISIGLIFLFLSVY